MGFVKELWDLLSKLEFYKIVDQWEQGLFISGGIVVPCKRRKWAMRKELYDRELGEIAANARIKKCISHYEKEELAGKKNLEDDLFKAEKEFKQSQDAWKKEKEKKELETLLFEQVKKGVVTMGEVQGIRAKTELESLLNIKKLEVKVGKLENELEEAKDQHKKYKPLAQAQDYPVKLAELAEAALLKEKEYVLALKELGFNKYKLAVEKLKAEREQRESRNRPEYKLTRNALEDILEKKSWTKEEIQGAMKISTLEKIEAEEKKVRESYTFWDFFRRKVRLPSGYKRSLILGQPLHPDRYRIILDPGFYWHLPVYQKIVTDSAQQMLKDMRSISILVKINPGESYDDKKTKALEEPKKDAREPLKRKDIKNLMVSCNARIELMDLAKAYLEVLSYKTTIEDYILSILPYYCIGRTLEEWTNRETVKNIGNDVLKEIRGTATEKWGIKIWDVYITDVILGSGQKIFHEGLNLSIKDSTLQSLSSDD